MENIHRLYVQQMNNSTLDYYRISKNVKEMQEKGAKYDQNGNLRRNSQGK